jgi:peptidoglycan/xylan/chitin deacetylase (PgdA/CDA1 family)
MIQPHLSASVTVDFDAMSSWIARGLTEDISRGEFDAIAVPRLLSVFKRNGVRTTFFIPGHTALAYPHLVEAIAAEGHEIGHHGWVHETADATPVADARRVFERGLAALEQAAGITPVGHRTSGVRKDFSTTIVDLLLEYGFLYDSSLLGSDFVPYYLRRGDVWSTHDAFSFGAPTPIVEIAWSYMLDDWQFFEFRGGWTSKQARPDDVLDIWKAEFEFAYAECREGIFDLIVHPLAIGRGSRLRMLEELINFMQTYSGVVFEPLADYAWRWRDRHPLDEWLAEDPPHAGLHSERSISPTGTRQHDKR